MKTSKRTITLKLYKPSRYKIRIIDEAMLSYSRAFQFLLDKAQSQIDEIRVNYTDVIGKYSAQSVMKWISKDVDRELNNFSIEPFKDSIKLDFSGAVAEYLNKKKKDNSVKYPCAYISDDEEERQYDSIMRHAYNEDINMNVVERKIERLLSKAERVRPLFFCRCAANRNYSIVYDPEKGRYFAKIYLINSKSENRKKPSKIYKRELFYIDKNKKPFYERGNRRTFLMFPLTFGKWQENFLKEAVEKPELIKTARLIKRRNEYYLAVNIIKDRPEEIKALNYMGISRGFDNAINYSIIDTKGQFVTSGAVNEIEKHKIANKIVNIALEYRCRVIMEKFLGRGDKLYFEDQDGKCHYPKMGRVEYNMLVEILRYKLPDSGLPDLTRVSSTNIFYSCPNCGINSIVNRFNSSIFMCVSCGTTMNIEKVGSLNLAKRIIKYNSDMIKIYVEKTARGIRFINKELDFEYYPLNPYDCAAEFSEEIEKIIKNFYNNINEESQKKNYRRKLSMIKKIENNRQKNMFELIIKE